MDTQQIETILRKIPLIRLQFSGVFALDKIPLLRQIPNSMVINLDTSDMEGSHWIALYTDNNNRTTYFDSLGRPPPKTISSKYKIHDYLRKPVQSIFSNSCGQYCILFIYLITHGHPLPIIEQLLRNISDSNIKQLVNKLY
jgi:hypothetical protein